MKVKFKKLDPEAKIPKKAHPSDAGMDLVAISEKFIQSVTGPIYEYGTGIAMSLPKNTVGLLCARSSIANNTTLQLANGVGVLDENYRGEIKFQFRTLMGFPVKKYELGERIGQLVVVPLVVFESEETDKLDDTDRGTGGFGSSGV